VILLIDKMSKMTYVVLFCCILLYDAP